MCGMAGYTFSSYNVCVIDDGRFKGALLQILKCIYIIISAHSKIMHSGSFSLIGRIIKMKTFILLGLFAAFSVGKSLFS